MITTVAVAGVDTHICVEGTVRHGYDIGYRMLVLSDLVGTRQSELSRHEAALALCERYFGLTLQSDRFLELCKVGVAPVRARANN
jgi:ureidoacrylate peracid hydrolase